MFFNKKVEVQLNTGLVNKAGEVGFGSFCKLVAVTLACGSLAFISQSGVAYADQGAPNNPRAVKISNEAVVPAPVFLVGNRVWLDSNPDGLMTTDELGVDGVQVALVDLAGGMKISTTTANGGFYTFTNVSPATYTLKFDLPSGYAFTTQDAFANMADELDSDADPLTGLTAPFALDQNNLSMDAGLRQIIAPTPTPSPTPAPTPAPTPVLPQVNTISGSVWDDANHNGVRDVSEAGISGVEVALVDNTERELVRVPSDVDGNFVFINIPDGVYCAKFIISHLGYTFTSQIGAIGSASNSDANPASGYSDAFPVSQGALITYVDAGMWQPVTLGDLGWLDANGDGFFNPGTEKGQAGVTVELYQDTNGDSQFTPGSDAFVAQMQTNADGKYLFEQLVASNPNDLSTRYFVVITSSNFITGGALSGLKPSSHAVNFNLTGNTDNQNHGFAKGDFSAPQKGAYGVSSPIALTRETQSAGLHTLNGLSAAASSQTLDFGFSRNAPTAITLSYFQVTQTCDSAQIKWETLQETDTAGYLIFRSRDGLRANAELVNAQMIAAMGTGSEYALSDSSIKADRAYTYWLTEVTVDGQVKDQAWAVLNAVGCAK